MSLIGLPSQSKYSHVPREVHPQQSNAHLLSLSFRKQDKQLRARGFLSGPRNRLGACLLSLGKHPIRELATVE